MKKPKPRQKRRQPEPKKAAPRSPPDYTGPLLRDKTAPIVAPKEPAVAPKSVKRTVRTPRPRGEPSSVSPGRCQVCGAVAVPGEIYCYTHL